MSDSELDELADEVRFLSPMREESSTGNDAGEEMAKNVKLSPISSTAKKVLIAQRESDDIDDILAEGDESFKPVSVKTEKGGNDDDKGTSPRIYDDDKKYKLIRIGNSSQFCGNVMGQGVYFCTNRNCTVGHRESGHVKLADGQLYVKKTGETGKSKAFALPTISSTELDDQVVEKWLAMNQTLHSWSRNFRLAKRTIDDGTYPNTDNLLKEKKEMTDLRKYKTPKKAPMEKSSEANPSPSFKRFASDDKEGASDEEEEQFKNHVDGNFEILHNEMKKMKDKQATMFDIFQNTSQSINLRLGELQDDVGIKPSHLSAEFDAPSLWGTLGILVNTVEELRNKVVRVTEESKKVDVKMAAILTQAKDESVKGLQPVQARVEQVKSLMVKALKNLRNRAEANTYEISNLSKIVSTSSSQTVDTSSSVDLSSLEKRLEDLELRNNGDMKEKMIKFHGLDFTSKDQADAWLELHSPQGDFGFLVDFHTLMEHVHHSITGVDSLKQLQNVYKLKLSTISESLAITSFEVSSPRFFHNAGVHVVIDNEASCFSNINSFKKWNDASSGYKFRLKKELEKFRRSHMSTIREKISVRSPLYTLATSSLTESISWATGLINYIDVTYEEYSAGKFGSAKSWHITTKLAMALINEIGKPREGSLNSFEAGNGVSMSKVIFYSVLQSLDKMSEVAAADYRDSPVVSTELVKFLSLNTSVEAVDKLESKAAELTSSISTLTKDITSASKSVGSVGNKTDELKKVVESLRKRIEKLEKK